MRAALALGALALAWPRPAAADGVDFFGPARAIWHASSASRDTAALGLHIAPHRVLTGGGEFALVGWHRRGLSLRLGFFGMLELESDGETSGLAPFPSADIRFWRGHWGYQLAATSVPLARRLCGDCELEAAAGFHHESEHYTGANSGGPGTDYSDRPHVGDFFIADVAGRHRLGDWELSARLQHKLFLPGRSGYRQGPGADAGVRWRRWRRVQPFASTFAEYLTGTMGFPDAYLVRGLAGVALPAGQGDLYLYLAADVGHRKGLPVFTEERTLGGGIRATFF